MTSLSRTIILGALLGAGALVSRAHALDMTCTNDPGVLRNALLVQPIPPGVNISSFTLIPADASCDDSFGTYTGFNLVSGSKEP